MSTNCGARKTKIMFSANLNFKQLEKYLRIALREKLIKLNESTYELTADGLQFIENYKEYRKHFLKAQEKDRLLGIEREKLSFPIQT